MSKIEYLELFKTIEASESIALFMHVNPDGDCISSMLAMYGYLCNMGKKPHCFSAEFNSASLPQKFSFLPNFDKINSVEPLKKYDLSIGVDLGDESRIGDSCFRLFIKSKNTFVIDHHSSFRNFAQKTIREENAASTTQILYKLFSLYNEKLIDGKIAECLYTGIVTDSGGFSFNNTTSETHEIAAKLLSYDFDASNICRKAMKDIKLNTFLLKGRVMGRLELFEENRIAYLYITQEDFAATKTSERDTEGFVNAILDIVGVEIAITVTEIKDKSYKISFRSKGKVDASACAKCFGGGGHFNASGCAAYGYYEDVYNKILSVAKEMLSYA